MKNSDNNNRVFGFVVLYGFETKNFLSSGMYEKLGGQNKPVILRRNFPTKNFNEYIEKYDLDEIVIKTGFAKDRLKIENLFLASRRARQRVNKVRNFNYFKSDRKKKLSDYLLGNSIVSSMLRKVTKTQITRHYYDSDLEKLYVKKGITDLVIAGYSSPEAISLANTALEDSRNVWLVINSWKDFYVNDFIPFTPTKTFVWSESMKKQLLEGNDHIKTDDVIVTGNPAFDRFNDYLSIHSAEYYGEKYNFNPNRPLILYSMISPIAYDKEKEIIELINLELIKTYPAESHRPLIILRRNPIDETLTDESFYTGNNVRYADNYFEGSYENAVFVQLIEGETEWLDLLKLASVNINIASTVTLESLLQGTPVINNEFDSNGLPDGVLKRYADAPFYTPLTRHQMVFVTKTLEELMIKLDHCLKIESRNMGYIPMIEDNEGNAVSRISRVIVNT